MAHEPKGTLIFILKTLIFAAMISVFFIGQMTYYKETLYYFWGNNIILLLYAILLYFTGKLYEAHKFGTASLPELIISWILSLVITNAFEYLQFGLLVSALLPIKGFAIILSLQSALIIPLVWLTNKIFYYINPIHNAIIICGPDYKVSDCQHIANRMSKRFKINSIISQNEPMQTKLKNINRSESVFFVNADAQTLDSLLEYCFSHNKRAYIFPSFLNILLSAADISWIDGTPVLLSNAPVLSPVTRFIKRCMDIFISLFMLIALSWLLVITWFAIWIYDRHPAIFKQTRITRNDKEFTLYKFRSMRPDAESDGVPRLASRNDERITLVGAVIRRTRIDELPQLWNVLTGDMSLVGPRPERPEIIKQYEQVYPNYSFRTKVKAGLTGFAQIYGRYNMAPDEKLFLDIMYIERYSIWQDIKLLMQTPKVLLMPSRTEGIEEGAKTALKD